MIYLICFAASVALAFFANRATRKRYLWLFSALSILVVVLLAGLREYHIGTDTYHYYSYKRYWLGATSYDSLWEYMRYYMSIGYGEPLFALLVGVIGQVFGHYSVLLFVVHGVIISCVYIGAFRFRKYVEPAWFLLLFYLFYFGQSLNIMRQYMAMAIVFVAFADIQKRKYIRYGIAVAIATLIHTSALLSVLPLVFWFILKVRWSPLDKTPWIRWAVVLGLTLAALIFLPLLAKILMYIGILSDKYSFYFSKDSVEPAILSSLFAIAGLSGIILFRKVLRRRCRQFPFYALNSITFFLLMQFSWVMAYGKRLAAYQLLPNLLAVAMLERVHKTKYNKWIMRFLLLGAGLAYWAYAYVLRNASQTMPYRFFFS